MKGLGKRLRELRIKNDMSQDYVARALGVTVQAVSKWENGKSDPDISNLIPISSLFHIHVDELLDKEQYRKEWEEDWRNLQESGNREKNLLFLKDAVVTFPGDCLFRYRLASEEYFCAEHEKDPGKRIRLLILSDEHFESLHKEFPEFLTAIDMHVKVLVALGQNDKAIELAKASPNHERLLLSVLKGNELDKHKKRLATISLLNLFADLIRDGSFEALKKAEILLISVADKERQFLSLLLDVYYQQAKFFCKGGNYNAAVNALRLGLQTAKSVPIKEPKEVEERELYFYPILSPMLQNALIAKFNSYLHDKDFSCLSAMAGYDELLTNSELADLADFENT